MCVSFGALFYRFNDFNCGFFFFKQKTAYELRISDWSSDVCSSDLIRKVTVTVYEGRVLLTGVVGTEFSRDEATRLAWAASDRINEVINELQVDANDSLLDSASEIGRASCRERVCQYV